MLPSRGATPTPPCFLFSTKLVDSFTTCRTPAALAAWIRLASLPASWSTVSKKTWSTPAIAGAKLAALAQVALDDLGLALQMGHLSRIADQDAELDVILKQLSNELAADSAGGAGDEDHGWLSSGSTLNEPQGSPRYSSICNAQKSELKPLCNK